jgi:hypothetical protein
MLSGASPAVASVMAPAQSPTSVVYLPAVQNEQQVPTSTVTPTSTRTPTPCPTDTVPTPGGCSTITPTPTNTLTPELFSIDGVWGGTTSQNEAISFEIRDHGFISFTTSYKIGGCGSTVTTFGGNIPIHGNTFYYIQALFNGVLIITSGTFNSDSHATGTIEVSGTFCGDFDGIWQADKRNGSSSTQRKTSTVTPTFTPINTPTPKE